MKKEFLNPSINFTCFDEENILTESNATLAEAALGDAATAAGKSLSTMTHIDFTITL